jgi:hypothetical protein
MFKYIKNALTHRKQPHNKIPDVGESCIDFAIWVQDNYSQNKYVGTNVMLPTGQMRKDCTNNIYTMSEIFQHYKIAILNRY